MAEDVWVIWNQDLDEIVQSGKTEKMEFYALELDHRHVHHGFGRNMRRIGCKES